MIKVCHINLAKGFRGGERQTELLIKGLGGLGAAAQIIILRKDSPLIQRLRAFEPNIEIRAISKPYIMCASFIKDCQLLHAHDAKAAQFAYLATRIHNRPYLITRRVPNPIKKNPLSRRIYWKAAKIVALSRAIRNVLERYDTRLKPVVIPSMVSNLPVDRARSEEIRRTYAGRFLVGHAGALVNRHKGQQYLLEAAKLLKTACPDIHFVLLGKGKDESWLKNMAVDLGNVEFAGFHENIGDFLAAFDLFAFPSLQEGLGSVLLDAMQFGLPIVASDVDGIPDIIVHEKNGLLIPPGSGKALAEAIMSLYRNEDQRRILSENACTTSKAYQPVEIARRYLEIYRQIIDKST